MRSKRRVPRGTYVSHIIQPQEGERFICDYCNRSYKRKAILLSHMKSNHLNRNTECIICGRGYRNKSSYNRHMKKVHSIWQTMNLGIPLNTHVLNGKPLLPINESRAFPSLRNLVFKENINFGKHLVTSEHVSMGEVVIEARPFARIEYWTSTEDKCFECNEITKKAFITCPHCPNVRFCSEKCSLSQLHKTKCQAIFSCDDCYIVRLTVEIMRTAIQSAPNMTAFLEFCGGILFEGKKSITCIPPFSTYGEIIQLKCKPIKKNVVDIANRARNLIMKLPELQKYKNRGVLNIMFNLALRHAASIETNCFCEATQMQSASLVRCCILDAASRINHSCSPNVNFSFIEEHGVVIFVANQPIQKGKQIFISYLKNDLREKKTERRQKYLRRHWNFICRCRRCKERS